MLACLQVLSPTGRGSLNKATSEQSLFLCTPRRTLIANVFISYLNPGGWIELADIVFPIESDDGTVAPDSAIKKWGDLSLEAAKVLGRPLDSGKFYKEQLEAAGFTNVVSTIYKWPQNAWAADKKHKELGMCLCNSLLLFQSWHGQYLLAVLNEDRGVVPSQYVRWNIWAEYGTVYAWPEVDRG